jgi:hypothetical protein
MVFRKTLQAFRFLALRGGPPLQNSRRSLTFAAGAVSPDCGLKFVDRFEPEGY